jgi:hypothetical protein
MTQGRTHEEQLTYEAALDYAEGTSLTRDELHAEYLRRREGRDAHADEIMQEIADEHTTNNSEA